MDAIPSIAFELVTLLEGEMYPVVFKAQLMVPVPQELDLDSWINEDAFKDDETIFSEESEIDFWGEHKSSSFQDSKDDKINQEVCL